MNNKIIIIYDHDSAAGRTQDHYSQISMNSSHGCYYFPQQIHYDIIMYNNTICVATNYYDYYTFATA